MEDGSEGNREEDGVVGSAIEWGLRGHRPGGARSQLLNVGGGGEGMDHHRVTTRCSGGYVVKQQNRHLERCSPAPGPPSPSLRPGGAWPGRGAC